ncbi:MAG: cobalt transporter [Rhodanobacter sp. SCN 65-17]|jgi:cobalt-zinc-cadmium efflux system protein|uniref:cation diffusion facilitator family transporter n=1 Tax=Rhodanobacter sp. PCA2 TaxID=2006117 RepID=UPI00086BFBD9|nr:cation diffusion facilitator family transporter [Rhodanobacter sp. PCA2]MBA2079446.1 cation transporter [Rhodanobacter sp. PCA2]ODU66815.1 MAG: cobalt transporter [Rhodanobacter sp. SCN 65-17]
MAHDHAHGSAHAHDHAPKDFGTAFAVGIGLNLAFVATEAVYGYIAHSLALLADAGHNLSDVLGLALAWGATVLVKRQPTRRRTYGLRRSSILASLLNAVLLLVAIGAIAWEAIGRFSSPQPVASGIVMAVAGIGVVINGITAWLFMAGSKNDVNIRGAFLHMAADAAVSLGVVVAALAMRTTGWLWLDPTVSLVIVVVIAVGTWGLLKHSLDLAMDAVPPHIDPQNVESYLAGLPGISAVHDLHIWGMSTTEVALTVHLVKPDAQIEDALLAQIKHDLHAQFGIDHTTVQLELGDKAHPCGQAPVSTV